MFLSRAYNTQRVSPIGSNNSRFFSNYNRRHERMGFYRVADTTRGTHARRNNNNLLYSRRRCRRPESTRNLRLNKNPNHNIDIIIIVRVYLYAPESQVPSDVAQAQTCVQRVTAKMT